MAVKYEFLEHTADIKVKAYGETLNEVFENVVLAVSEYVSREGKIKSKKMRVMDVSGKDNESLLYNFIDELLYLIDADNFIPARAKVTLRGKNLRAEISGDDAENYSGLDHIKAATYAEMFIKKSEDGWQAQFVIDV
jgi:SHS2 domain-containing protein